MYRLRRTPDDDPRPACLSLVRTEPGREGVTLCEMASAYEAVRSAASRLRLGPLT